MRKPKLFKKGLGEKREIQIMTKKRQLGLGTTKDGDFKLPLNTLQRHLGSFGSSGSGKTVASKVLIEELAISGVPVIAFDPQGDIASLWPCLKTILCSKKKA